MLTFKNITKSINNRVLFDNISYTVNWGERVALVGANGAGKSTLFKIIQGVEDPDQGQVNIDEYAIVGFLDQEAGNPGETSILDIACGIDEEMTKALYDIKNNDETSELYGSAFDIFNEKNGFQLQAKAKKILAGLGFKQTDFEQPASEYSGGWIMRAHLAQLLVLEPDLLILDEPTNHLDLMAIIWLQRYLAHQFPGGLFVISHDRDFMDEAVDSVIEIDDAKLNQFPGNYSFYLKERELRYEQSLERHRKKQKEIEHIQEFIDRFRSTTSKASQVQSRIKQVEKMKAEMEKPRNPSRLFKFSFPDPQRSHQKVIGIEKGSKSYGEKVIYNNLDVLVERGEKIVLVGPNGAGKSTLIKILAGEEKLDSGELITNYATEMGYYSQHRSESLDPHNSVLEEVMKNNGELREDEARSILGSFLFRRTDVHKKTAVLSGGEKSRLNLVKFLVNPPNLLLMDEPTTHLDLMSIEALTQALQKYTGTLVFISHDIHFIKNLAERTWHIADGAITQYAGGYDYYIEKSGLLADDKFSVTS